MKQVIVMRKDLNMRKGKMIAQGAHSSVTAITNYRSNPDIETWLQYGQTKICVYVESEKALLEIWQKAVEAGVIRAIITDSGKTEFHGVPTKTCVAVGPADPAIIDKITGGLPLL